MLKIWDKLYSACELRMISSGIDHAIATLVADHTISATAISTIKFGDVGYAGLDKRP